MKNFFRKVMINHKDSVTVNMQNKSKRFKFNKIYSISLNALCKRASR